MPVAGAYCTQCGFENLPQRGACLLCFGELAAGKIVGPACPQCSAQNRAGARFCGSCGSALEPGVQPAPSMLDDAAVIASAVSGARAAPAPAAAPTYGFETVGPGLDEEEPVMAGPPPPPSFRLGGDDADAGFAPPPPPGLGGVDDELFAPPPPPGLAGDEAFAPPPPPGIGDQADEFAPPPPPPGAISLDEDEDDGMGGWSFGEDDEDK